MNKRMIDLGIKLYVEIDEARRVQRLASSMAEESRHLSAQERAAFGDDFWRIADVCASGALPSRADALLLNGIVFDLNRKMEAGLRHGDAVALLGHFRKAKQWPGFYKENSFAFYPEGSTLSWLYNGLDGEVVMYWNMRTRDVHFSGDDDDMMVHILSAMTECDAIHEDLEYIIQTIKQDLKTKDSKDTTLKWCKDKLDRYLWVQSKVKEELGRRKDFIEGVE